MEPVKRVRRAPIKEPTKGGVANPLYEPEMFPQLAERACEEFGATLEQLANLFDVSEQTIHVWQRKHPEFKEAIQRGRDNFDSEKVEKSLLRRALGYKVNEVVINRRTGEPITITKHVPASDTAIIFWLKNRQPKRWRDVQEKFLRGEVKTEHEHKGEIKVASSEEPGHLIEVARILRQAGAFDRDLLAVGAEEGAQTTTH